MTINKRFGQANQAIYNKKFPNGEIPTPDEKRELIDDLYKYMINFAQQGLTLKMLEKII